MKTDIGKTERERSLEQGVSTLSSLVFAYHKAFFDVWDSVSDLLTQDQIERIETIHENDFDLFSR